jgi:serine protease Do
MKKILIFLSFTLIAVIGAFNVYGEESPSTTTTIFTTNTISTEQAANVYYYSDYQDLIDQIYADVYDDIYDDLYDSLINQIDDDFYNQIYAQVETRIAEILENEDFSVYVDDFQQLIFDVVDIANKSVIGVANYLGSTIQAVGSGVIYKYDESTQEYFIITNEHVIADGNNFTVVFEDKSEYEATLLGYDTEVDIAILSFKASDRDDIIVSSLGDSDVLKKGSILVASGNPQGFSFYGSVTLGLVSGVGRKVDTNQYIDYIQHDAAINSGNSGGPIFNIDGEVVGINVSKFASTDIEGMGFAIPINLIKRIIARIEIGNFDENTIIPRLGAQYYDVSKIYDDGEVRVTKIVVNGERRTDPITIILPAGINSGFLLHTIDSGLTLGLSPLKSGDLIYQIDDFLITNEKDYYKYIYANYETGDTIMIHYYSFDDNTYEYNPEQLSVEVTWK